MLSTDGLLVAIEPRSSLFKDVVFGLDSNWFLPDAPSLPGLLRPSVSPLRSIRHWLAQLDEVGFRNSEVVTVRCGSDHAYLILAEGERAGSAVDQVQISAPRLALEPKKTALVVASARSCEVADRLKASLTVAEWFVSTIADLAPNILPSARTSSILVPEFARCS